MSTTADLQKVDTTPVKEQPAIATADATTAVVAAPVADAASSAAATPARLNANAKSFVPVKLDEAAVSTGNNGGASANTNIGTPNAANAGTATPAADGTATPASAAAAAPKSNKKADRSPKTSSASKKPASGYANNGKQQQQGGVGIGVAPMVGGMPQMVGGMPPPHGAFMPPGGVNPFMMGPVNPMMMGMNPHHPMMMNQMMMNQMAMQHHQQQQQQMQQQQGGAGVPNQQQQMQQQVGGAPQQMGGVAQGIAHPHPMQGMQPPPLAMPMHPHHQPMQHMHHPQQQQQMLPQQQQMMLPHGHHPQMVPPPHQHQMVHPQQLALLQQQQMASSGGPPNAANMMMNPMALMMGGGAVQMPHTPSSGAVVSPQHHQQQQMLQGMPPMMHHSVSVGVASPTGAVNVGGSASSMGMNPNLVASPTGGVSVGGGGANPSLMSLMPTTPLVGGGGNGSGAGLNASMNVSVGNASLAALRSTAPQKFACVILIGLPSSGKTTIGRQLVSELSEDRMGWSFFSGSDYLKETGGKKAPWETTRDVFDGLGTYVDNVLANQGTNPTRGLVIDKNVKGIEDIHYLSALLRSKGLQLNGIVSFDSTNDDALLERLGGEDGKERLKFYRVILNRIQDGTKGTNLFHVIDSSKPLVDSLKALRTQVLGCSAMQNVRPLGSAGYGDTNCALVDDYIEYCRVMTAVSSYAKTPKPNQFPGLVNFTPLSNKTLEDRKFRASLSEGSSYCVRRKPDGSKFVLYHENGQLYLVPRHQRAVLRVPAESWIGFQLNNCGPFILDGELVRLAKEANREKYLACDVIFWAEKGSTQNIARGPWKERQERLRTYLVNETNSFFHTKANLVIVHQKIVGSKEIAELFEPCEYPVEGIAFHSTARREDPTILWRPPRHLTADFRLGALTSTPTTATPASPKENTTTHSYEVEVFDAKAYPPRYATYTRYGNVEVVLNARHTPPAPGTIVTCGLTFEGEGFTGKRTWKFLVARPDLTVPIFKLAADELLDDCIVPKERVTKVLIEEKLMVDPVAAKAAAEAAALAATQVAARTGFGTHLSPADASTTASPAVGVAAAPRAAPTMRDILMGAPPRRADGKTPASPAPTVGVSPNPNFLNTSAGNLSITVGGASITNITVGGTPLVQPRTPLVTVGIPTAKNSSVTVGGIPAPAPSAAAVAAVTSPNPTAAEKSGEPKEERSRNAGNARNGKKDDANAGTSSDKKSKDKDASAAADKDKDSGAATDAISKRRCNDCKREKNEADGRVDKAARNHPFYCFGCWAKEGSEFCNQCSGFGKGHRDPKARNRNAFYCEPCWVKYDERKKREKNKKESSSAAEGAAASATSEEKKEKEGDAAAANDEKKDGRRRRGEKKDASAEEKKDERPTSDEKKEEKKGRGRNGTAAAAAASPAATESPSEKKEKESNRRGAGRGEKKEKASADATSPSPKEEKEKKDGRRGRGEKKADEEKKDDKAAEEKVADEKSTAAKGRERKPRGEKKEKSESSPTDAAAAAEKKEGGDASPTTEKKSNERKPRERKERGSPKEKKEGDAAAATTEKKDGDATAEKKDGKKEAAADAAAADDDDRKAGSRRGRRGANRSGRKEDGDASPSPTSTDAAASPKQATAAVTATA